MTIIAQFGFNHICSLQNLAWIIPTIFCINRLSSSNKIFKVLINKWVQPKSCFKIFLVLVLLEKIEI